MNYNLIKCSKCRLKSKARNTDTPCSDHSLPLKRKPKKKYPFKKEDKE